MGLPCGHKKGRCGTCNHCKRCPRPTIFKGNPCPAGVHVPLKMGRPPKLAGPPTRTSNRTAGKSVSYMEVDPITDNFVEPVNRSSTLLERIAQRFQSDFVDTNVFAPKVQSRKSGYSNESLSSAVVRSQAAR